MRLETERLVLRPVSEDDLDTLPVPGAKDADGNPDEGKQSLLTQVCARSKAVGELEDVSGARPYCTPDGVGAVLKVFPDRAVSVNQACPATPFVAAYEGRTPGTDASSFSFVRQSGELRT